MAIRHKPLGIDHGTSNSSIAVMTENGPHVIKVNGVDTVMPSALYIYRTGRELIGHPAYQAMYQNGPGEGDGCIGYKLRIGQDTPYAFREGKMSLRPPEVGARVIRELLRAFQLDAQQDPDQIPEFCVITVPAEFDQSAVAGTREAAKIAGLKHFPLLMEPIAASLAYGFTATDERGQWIVFDIGGGTLDISLVIVRGGRMIVPEDGHAGDDRLGGRLFDRELFDHVMTLLERDYKLTGLRSAPEMEPARNRLSLAIEKAKIRLSNRDTATVEIDGELCKDDRGKPVNVCVDIQRSDYERLIGPHIEKAVHVCQNLITRNRLAPGDVTRLILVGGPSKTPYLQKMLADRLGIPLDFTIDPMTAVAQGAAVYAETVEIEPDAAGGNGDDAGFTIGATAFAAGTDTLTLTYQRHSKLATYELGGRLTGPSAGEGNCSVEVRRKDGKWSSGRVPADPDGFFTVNLLLIESSKPTRSQFTCTAYDARGNRVASVDEPEIWYPYLDTEGALKATRSLRVATAGNRSTVLVAAGDTLPTSGHGEFYTTKAVPRGSAEVLRIPVIESVTNLLGHEDDHADCNYRVGTLLIEGRDDRLTSDLPEGADIEVTLEVDQSRNVTVTAYIPLLRSDFTATFSPEGFGVPVKDVQERFDILKLQLDNIRKLNARRPLDEVAKGLATIDRVGIVGEIEKELTRAKLGSIDASLNAFKKVLELASTLYELMRSQEHVAVQARIEELEPVCNGHERTELDSIKRELQVSGQNPEANARVKASLDELDMKVRLRPFYDLLLDLMALDSKRGNPDQIALANQAGQLFDRIKDKGGIEKASEADLREMADMHRKLEAAWPELGEWRDEVIREFTKSGRSLTDLAGGDIQSKS